MEQRDLEFLKDQDVPEAVRVAYLQQLYAAKAETDRLAFDRKKFIWGTPLVAAVAGLLTLAGTAFFDVYRSDEATENTLTIEQLRAELAANETQRAAERSASAEERQFQFKIVERELDSEKSQAERAAVLLFLVRAGILNSLDEQNLLQMAEEALAPDADPEKVVIPSFEAAELDPLSLSPNGTRIGFAMEADRECYFDTSSAIHILQMGPQFEGASEKLKKLHERRKECLKRAIYIEPVNQAVGVAR